MKLRCGIATVSLFFASIRLKRHIDSRLNISNFNQVVSQGIIHHSVGPTFKMRFAGYGSAVIGRECMVLIVYLGYRMVGDVAKLLERPS